VTSGAAAAREARRTALVLAGCLAVVGAAAPIAISLGGLAGFYLLGEDKSLATLPITAFNVGVALGAIPAGLAIRALGQRSGFMTGTLVTALGGLIATFALFQASFWIFALGLLVLGGGGAFVQQFRFAAADSAPPEFKARAISFVMAGGIFTAIIGPQIVIFTRDLLAPVMFAGAFAAILLLAAVGAVLLSFLPVASKTAISAEHEDGTARPLMEIAMQPQFAIGLLCAVGSYALMSLVMTGAPLAMVGCGFSPDDAALGISWHVMAMFAPSFFTGALIARFGKETIVAAGLVLLVGCAAVALSGIELWQFWTALILLGLGWNFAFIGSTAMVAASYRRSEQGKVQGPHDFILFTSVALGSLLAGVLYNMGGWQMLNWIVLPVVAVCMLGIAWLALTTRKSALS
jgi:MFS family permease